MSHASTANERSESSSRAKLRRKFFIGVGAFVSVLSVVGFGPSLVDQRGRSAPLTPLVLAHGLVSSAWLLLFLTQALLVAVRRTPLHRRLGSLGLVLTIAAIASGVLTTTALTQRGYDLSGDLTPPGVPTPSLEDRAVGMLPALDGLMAFGALAVAGLCFRRRPAVHKRLMTLALLALVPVPLLHLAGHISRQWPAARGTLFLALVITTNLAPFSVAVHDWLSERRIHPVSLWVPVLMTAQVIATQTLLMPSAVWRAVAVWLVGFV